MTRHSDIDARLAGLYAQVPDIPGCKGLCWVSCGPVDMSDREWQRIKDRGYRVSMEPDVAGKQETHWCEALTAEGRCAVYDIRPLGCRLWGATETMPCPYRCEPDGPPLTAEQRMRLVLESMHAGGVRGMELTAGDVQDGMRRYLADPAVRAEVEANQARGRRGIRLRMAETQEKLPPEVTSRKRRQSKGRAP